MSRFLSLCSQLGACGRLTRAVQWLDDGCADDRVFGNEEVGLGKAVGKAGSVGCCIGDKNQALHELASFTQCSEGETDESRQVKGRALLCGALFGQENKEVMGVLIECFQNDIQLGTTTLRQIYLRKPIVVFPIAALFQRSSDMNDVYGVVFLGCCYQKGDGVPRDKKKAIESYERAAEMGNVDAMSKLY